MTSIDYYRKMLTGRVWKSLYDARKAVGASLDNPNRGEARFRQRLESWGFSVKYEAPDRIRIEKE